MPILWTTDTRPPAPGDRIVRDLQAALERLLEERTIRR